MPRSAARLGAWSRLFLFGAAVLVGVGLLVGGAMAQGRVERQGKGQASGGGAGTDSPQAVDAFMFLQPGISGTCAPPTNGGSVPVGCSFVLDLMVNAGTNAAPDGVTAQQSYLTFTYQIIQNARVSTIGAGCTLTSTVTADIAVLDAILQNEVCNGAPVPGTCTFRGIVNQPGWWAFATGALQNCPEGCPDPDHPDPEWRAAQTGWCASAPGQALMHWQFNPPAPATRDTQVVSLSGGLIHDPALFTDYTFCVGAPGSCVATATPTLGGATDTPTSGAATATPTITRTRTRTITPTITLTPTSVPTCGTGANYLINQYFEAFIEPGTTVVAGTQCDDCVTTIPLPFTYNFYGIPFGNVRLGINGNIQFTTTNFAYDSACLPNSTFDYSIFPYWDDLDASPNLTSSLGALGIYTSVTGSAPDRVFNIEWRVCRYNFGACGGDVNFEVQLFEGQDKFDILYGTLADNGAGATVGVQRHTGNPPFGSFTQFSCNANVLEPGLLLSFVASPCAEPTRTPTFTSTPTPTFTSTDTPTRTFTPTPTNTRTRTPTRTPTNTRTPTPTPLLIGHVNWQGRPAQPHALQQLPVTLTLKMGALEVNYPAQTTDASGWFTVAVTGLPVGTYNWRVKHPKFLANGGTVFLSGAYRQNVEMGLLRAGDCVNDNLVTISDFGVIKNSFGRAVGEPNYDDRADLDGNQVVTIVDVNWVKANFGLPGAPAP